MSIRTSTYWSSDHGIWLKCFCWCNHCEYWICTHLAPEIWSGEDYLAPEKGGLKKMACREISMQRDFSGQERRQAGTLWRIWDEVSWLTGKHNVAWTFSLIARSGFFRGWPPRHFLGGITRIFNQGSLTVAACKQIVQAFDVMAGPCEMENVLSAK